MSEQSGGKAPDINDPEAQNAEQEDSGAQAQQVAEEAREDAFRHRRSAGSGHGGHTNPAQLIPDDVQDLVDHMKDMDASGRIDMDAFAGEDNMDDEDGSIPE